MNSLPSYTANRLSAALFRVNRAKRVNAAVLSARFSDRANLRLCFCTPFHLVEHFRRDDVDTIASHVLDLRGREAKRADVTKRRVPRPWVT